MALKDVLPDDEVILTVAEINRIKAVAFEEGRAQALKELATANVARQEPERQSGTGKPAGAAWDDIHASTAKQFGH